MGNRGSNSHNGGGSDFSGVQRFLRSSFNRSQANAMMSALMNAPKLIQDLWIEYASQFRFEENTTGDAYYSPLLDKVTFQTNVVINGDVVHAPMTTAFHEFGHMTDYLIAASHGVMHRRDSYSEYYGRDSGAGIRTGLLAYTAKKEIETALISVGRNVASELQSTWARHPSLRDPSVDFSNLETLRSLGASRFLDAIKQDNARNRYRMSDFGDLSDILEGTGFFEEYPLGVGHGKDYWKNRDPSKEIYAEFSSAVATESSTRSLEVLNKYLPETYKVFLQMNAERKSWIPPWKRR